jgi:hypothetical protein
MLAATDASKRIAAPAAGDAGAPPPESRDTFHASVAAGSVTAAVLWIDDLRHDDRHVAPDRQRAGARRLGDPHHRIPLHSISAAPLTATSGRPQAPPRPRTPQPPPEPLPVKYASTSRRSSSGSVMS